MSTHPPAQPVPPAWAARQQELAKQVLLQDTHALREKTVAAARGDWSSTLRVAGVDLSFPRGEQRGVEAEATAQALAAVVVVEYGKGRTPRVVHASFLAVTLREPYVPNFLAFREAGPLVTLLKALQKRANVCPDVVLVDGNGVLHARRCGLASHVGVETGLPTVGVAKKLLCVRGLHDDDATAPVVRNPALPLRGCARQLRGSDGELLGAAYCGDERRRKSSKPRFVSAGHLVDTRAALAIVDACCEEGLSEPQPIRLADRYGRYLLAKHGTAVRAAGGKMDVVYSVPLAMFDSLTMHDDVDMECRECRETFTLEAGEQEFCALKRVPAPARCKLCRQRGK